MEEEMETIPTGFPDLDEAIGIGGLPCGRISELFGADSSGKQALAAAMAVQCQNQQGVVAWIDPAGRLDPEQMRVQGVRPDALLVARPRNELEALEMAVRLARSGGVKLLIFELAIRGREQDRQDEYGWTGWEEMGADMYAPTWTAGHRASIYTVIDGASRSGGGRAARPTGLSHSLPPALPPSLPHPSPFSLHPSLNLALRRLVAAVHKNRIAFLFIADSSGTQYSSEPSVISHQSSTQNSALRTQHSKGGQALRFFASVRLEIERREWIRRGKEVVGCRSAVRVVKNKLAAPHREAEVELWFYRFPRQEPLGSASRWPVLCQTN